MAMGTGRLAWLCENLSCSPTLENPEALTSSILSRAAVKLGAKPRAQRFSIDWLARALRHNELADSVAKRNRVRELERLFEVARSFDCPVCDRFDVLLRNFRESCAWSRRA